MRSVKEIPGAPVRPEARTRFTKGDEAVKPILLPGELDVPSEDDWEDMTKPEDKDLVELK